MQARRTGFITLRAVILSAAKDLQARFITTFWLNMTADGRDETASRSLACMFFTALQVASTVFN
jgi:hypothetical protein